MVEESVALHSAVGKVWLLVGQVSRGGTWVSPWRHACTRIVCQERLSPAKWGTRYRGYTSSSMVMLFFGEAGDVTEGLCADGYSHTPHSTKHPSRLGVPRPPSPLPPPPSPHTWPPPYCMHAPCTA